MSSAADASTEHTVVEFPRPVPPAPDMRITTLGPARIDSPMAGLLDARRTSEHYVDEDDRVLLDDTLAGITARGVPRDQLPAMEPCGPRRKIFFDPAKTRAAIVTCGGLCPGLNDVIAGLVRTLTYHYRVRRVVGIRNGYQGFIPRYGHDVVELTPEAVRDIATDGGTVLGTSRGPQDPDEIVDCLERLNINILFVIGGDGTMRGAMRIVETIAERGLYIAVVGVPKTIDNDIPYIDQSFGFQTAFSHASDAIRAARVEATATANGIGLVKLMGRHSGFIACYAALARSGADVVLIPEVPFALDGDNGLLAHLRRLPCNQQPIRDAAAERHQPCPVQVVGAHHDAGSDVDKVHAAIGLHGDHAFDAESLVPQLQLVPHPDLQQRQQLRVDPDRTSRRNVPRDLVRHRGAVGHAQPAAQGIALLYGLERRQLRTQRIPRTGGGHGGKLQGLGHLQAQPGRLLALDFRDGRIRYQDQIATEQLRRVALQCQAYAIGEKTHASHRSHRNHQGQCEQAQLPCPPIADGHAPGLRQERQRRKRADVWFHGRDDRKTSWRGERPTRSPTGKAHARPRRIRVGLRQAPAVHCRPIL